MKGAGRYSLCYLLWISARRKASLGGMYGCGQSHSNGENGKAHHV